MGKRRDHGCGCGRGKTAVLSVVFCHLQSYLQPPTDLLMTQQKTVEVLPLTLSPDTCQLGGSRALIWKKGAKQQEKEKQKAQLISALFSVPSPLITTISIFLHQLHYFSVFLPKEGNGYRSPGPRAAGLHEPGRTGEQLQEARSPTQAGSIADSAERTEGRSASNAPDPKAFKVPHGGAAARCLDRALYNIKVFYARRKEFLGSC